jgi:hypothetical protein
LFIFTSRKCEDSLGILFKFTQPLVFYQKCINIHLRKLTLPSVTDTFARMVLTVPGGPNRRMLLMASQAIPLLLR